MHHNIVLIDDNFAIRQIIKIFLARLSRKYTFDLNIFSSDNGVEGLGFVFITDPNIVIVDTTLPKYSGKNIVEFFVHNKKFQSKKVTVIVLEETTDRSLNLPKHFIRINKNKPEAFDKLTDVLVERLNISDFGRMSRLYDYIGGKVMNYSNKDDLLEKKLEGKFKLSNIFHRVRWAIQEIFISTALALIMLSFGKAKDNNISQMRLDKKLFRTKYYPTLAMTSVTLMIIFINLSLFIFSQYSLFQRFQEQARALTTYTVNSVGDEADFSIGDGFCDVDDSVGDGPCTLRAAIQEANVTVDLVDINFNITGAGPHTISLTSHLPDLSLNGLNIDGSTQSGSDCVNKDLKIIIDGQNTWQGLNFELSSGINTSSLKGLNVVRTGGQGIVIQDSSNINVTCSIIGLNENASALNPNLDDGIIVINGTNITIGGTNVGDGNIVAGNGDNGIRVDNNSTQVAIQGNYVGTNLINQDFGNTSLGIYIPLGLNETTTVTVGGDTDPVVNGSCTSPCNVVSYNNLGGVEVRRTALNPTETVFIQGNVITNNDQEGIHVNNGKNYSITQNLVSSNGLNGILFGTGASDNVTVDNNYIGTDITGHSSSPNIGSGIKIEPNATNLVSNISISNNTISANTESGITISPINEPLPSSASDITLSGNRIGLKKDLDEDLGNGASGIIVHSGVENVYIQTGNVIAFNTSDGITNLASTNSVYIHENSVFSNDNLGIDLFDDGITANDLGDVDAGANGLQNYPVLSTSQQNGIETSVYGTLNSTADTYYSIEFYSNTLADTSGNGEGKSFIGKEIVQTDVSGNYDFSVSPIVINNTPPSGEDFLSSTVTRCTDITCSTLEMGTSEFSNTIGISYVAPTDTPIPTSTETPVPTATDTPVPTATDTPLPTATNTPIPTAIDTPIPTPTITPLPTPTNTPVPIITSTSTPVLTNTPVVSSIPEASSTALQPTTQQLLNGPTPITFINDVTISITPTQTIRPTSQIPDEVIENLSFVLTPNDTYAISDDSVLKSPEVKSSTLSFTKRLDEFVTDSPIVGTILKTSIDMGERIKPLSDNLSYLLSLQFIGLQTAQVGVTTLNVLALATPAIVTAFSQPRILYYALAWFWKRKSKQPWGIVFDKATGAPVAFASLVLSQEGKTISTQATDLQGKYGFFANKGKYQLYISHSDYLELVSDVEVSYDGEIISQDFEVIAKSRDDVNSNIRWTLYKLKKQLAKNLFILNTTIFSIGFVYTIFAITNHLTIINYVILLLYLLQFLLMIVFYLFKEKEFGQVLDVSTGLPVSGAIVRIFNEDRQIDVAITDKQGRYSFTLEPGNYFLKATANGYVFPSENSPNITKNKFGNKLLKFTTQDKQRVNITVYMRKFASLNANKQVILSPFN